MLTINDLKPGVKAIFNDQPHMDIQNPDGLAQFYEPNSKI